MLTFADCLIRLDERARRLADVAADAGPDAPASTCRWNVAQLLAHQGMVHRWAAANVSGPVPDQTAVTREARQSTPESFDGRVRWLRDGATALVTALRDAPDDLKAMVFLKNAPSPRQFWARRQLHETTIHGVDVLSARLGRYPTTVESGVDRTLALDGLDELLRGFLPRGSSRLRSAQPLSIGIDPTDAGPGWLVRVTADPPQISEPDGQPVDLRLSGAAADLYLCLWNRGESVIVDGDPAVLALWRSKARVTWS